MNRTKIEWCNYTWNPIVGCSNSCSYCYARRQAKRFKHRCSDCYNFRWHIHPERLNEPERLKKSSRIFTCSMAELFDPASSHAPVMRVIDAMAVAEHHTFIVLTKRPDIMVKHEYHRYMPDNVWVGVSVESNANSWRLDYLKEYPGIKVLSLEPILGEFNHWMYFRDIDWVIIGAETGNRKDKHIPDRRVIEDIIIQTKKYDIPVFVKDSLKRINDYLMFNLFKEYPNEAR